jgi:RsiW-degrading membrane proteinase PrsW (M82 family)
VLGPECRIGAHASLSHAVLGARVYVYPGARIGQEGCSFASTDKGFLSVPHLVGWCWRMMWRSVPTRPSTVARPATR